MVPLKLVLASVIAFAAFSISAGAARADMMRACAAEISSQCKGVREGSGRIAACLYAHSNRLSGACKTEVDKVTNSGTVRLVIPAGIWKLKGSPYEADLVKACSGDANRLCRGVSGNERNLACLYSRAGQISAGCGKTAERVLQQVR